MKKSNKILLLTGLATVTIGTAGVLHTNYIQQPQGDVAKIQAYNYHPDNILDNVFELDNVTYLPFIFEDATQTISKEFVISEFEKKGLTITSQLKDIVGTGTKIEVKENNTVYTVLVYGDVNGDGKVNLIDAQLLILHHKNPATKALTGPYFIAGNVSNKDNDVINLIDAQRVIMLKKGTTKKLVVVEPVSIKEQDKVPPVITLVGDERIELEVGDTYTEEGAIAMDNYDGDLTSEIGVPIIKFIAEGSTQEETVGQVDTSKMGTYIITYTVADSNGNRASKSRVVIVKAPEIPPATIERIEITSQPTKTTYQYGETALDLTNATITIYTDDGNSTVKSITEKMLSAYDLTVTGEKEITVTYQGKVAPTTIKITVLKPISELILSSNGSNNVQETADGYQTNSKEDFVLGTIQAKVETGGSILQENQLIIEKAVTPTTDNTVTINDLTITTETDTSGNILIKGIAAKAGKYTIKAYIQYGENQKVEKIIELNVEKSNVVGQVKVEPTVENEIIKVGKAAIRKLTVINVNGEEIDVVSGNIDIPEINGIKIDKLSESGSIIDDDITNVASLQIQTTLEKGDTITVNMTVNGKPADFTFTVQDKSVLSSFEIAEDVLNLYAVMPNNATNVIPGASVNGKRNLYTLIEPIFKDQYGEEIIPMANDMWDSLNEDEVNTKVQEGKLGILNPKVTINVTIPGSGITAPLKNQKGIDIKYFKDEIVTTGGAPINKIGFSIILNEDGKAVDLTELDGQKVVLKCGSMTKELTVKVNYKELTSLKVDTSTIELEKDAEQYYVAKLNEKFRIGVITAGEGETPITADMLTTEGATTGINISYTADANKNIIVEGIVTQEGVYQIKPKLKPEYGNVVATTGIDIRGVSTPEIRNIAIDDFEIQIGETVSKVLAVESNLAVPNDKNPNGQAIKAGDITFKQTDATDAEVNYLKVELLDDRGLDIITDESNPDADLTAIAKKIRVTVNENVQENKNVKLAVTLFKGSDNEYTKEINISVSKPIPQGVTIGETSINLYDKHIEGITVEGSDGLVYTLVPIELFADSAKTRKIQVNSTLLTIDETDKQDKMYIFRPTITAYATIGDQQMPMPNQQVLQVEYFNTNKVTAVTDIKYIGIAMREIKNLTYNKADLNGKEIKLILGTATQDAPSATITLNYTSN